MDSVSNARVVRGGALHERLGCTDWRGKGTGEWGSREDLGMGGETAGTDEGLRGIGDDGGGGRRGIGIGVVGCGGWVWD